MKLGPRGRKTALTFHVVASVGWLGAVIACVALSVGVLVSNDAVVVWSSLVALELIARFALIPLSLASLLSGVVQSLGTPWGLLRHYWVVMKLTLNVIASIVLLLYLQTLVVLSDDARSSATITSLRDPSVLVHSIAALTLLVGATVLSVFKPRGLTRRGLRLGGA